MIRRTILTTLPLALSLALALPATAADDTTAAEVRKVDLEQGKVTLKHGEIRHLDMPAMTMVFHVRDKSLLAAVKAGDQVRFKAAHENGQYVVTDLKVQR